MSIYKSDEQEEYANILLLSESRYGCECGSKTFAEWSCERNPNGNCPVGDTASSVIGIDASVSFSFHSCID